MRGLYAIVDVGLLRARGVEPIAFAEAVLRAKPAALQLRAKELASTEVLGLLRTLAPMCRRAGTKLVANDRADLAVFAGCDMVHVGQGDTPIDRVRNIAVGMGVGISTHTPEELARALEARPTYVAYGPVFATTSKANPEDTVGMQGLQAACVAAARANIPLVAIGGITLERAAKVAEYAACAAVIAALMPPAESPERAVDLRDVTERARLLDAALRGSATVNEARP